MKILLTTDWFTPAVNGVVTSVLNLKRGLERRGHEVRVLTLSQSARSSVQGDVTRIGSLGAGAVYPGARLRISPGDAPVRELLAWKPDIVHSNCEFSTFFLARRIARQIGAPLIHTYHTVYEDYTHYFSPSRRWGRAVVSRGSHWVASQADAILAPTGKVRDILLGYGIETPLYVIPTGLELSRFHISLPAAERKALRRSLGVPDENAVLLYLGRLAREKNCGELIAAMDRLRDQPITLLLVGDGPARSELEQQVHDLGLECQILFTGMVPPEVVPRYYQTGNLFVSASTSETQGLTYIEALASGLPLLCRRDPCLEGVIAEGQNGWQYGSPEEFASLTLKFLAHPEEQERLHTAALEKAEDFSLENFAARAEAVYLERLEARTGRERESA